jgi:hypothetical protein
MWVIIRLVLAGLTDAVAGELLVEGVELDPHAARPSAAATAARGMSERRIAVISDRWVRV